MCSNSFHLMFMRNKIVIDITRQLPSEGGPESFAPDLRTALAENVPESFEVVEKKWKTYFSKWPLLLTYIVGLKSPGTTAGGFLSVQ